MSGRLILLCLLAAAPIARAQSTGGWGALPSPARASGTDAPAKTSAAPATGEAVASLPATPGEEATVVSTRERYLPGSEPHSPATRGRALDDPKNFRHTASSRGAIGLLQLDTADLGPRGVLRFSASGEYFSARDFPLSGATHTRTAGVFGLSVVPFDFLELYGAYQASANSNSQSTPPLVESLGDLIFGAKGSLALAPGLTSALDVRAQTNTATGNQDVRRNAIALAPLLALTYDPRAQLPLLPVRLHLNAGVVLDGGGANSALAQLGAPEQYALGFNAYHRATFGGGLEIPLPYATPFVEYRLAVPLGTPAEGLVGLDGERHAVSGALPTTLGLGAKVTAMRDVTFLLGAELGLTREVLLGVAPTPRFNLVAGASFNVDPFARAETRVVETVRERSPTELVTRPAPAPTEKLGTVAKVAGVVLDAKTRKPVPGVMIAFATASVPPVASDAGSGRFLTHELPGGKARLVARKGGYKDATVDLVLEAGKTASVEVLLEQLAERARFLVAITSAKKPIAAVASVEGPMTGKLEVPATATAPSALEVVPGRYLVNVSADGYLAQTREVQVSNGAEMALAFDLEKEPAKKLVVVKEKKIQILQQVHFASGKATILEDSYGLLNQVVDAIVRSGIPKIRVEGHTDNKGKKLVNLRLSQERARAVADYLEKAGIDTRRLDAKGYGDSRPVAPNLTERGRELNRRVEFMIVQE